MPEYQAGAATGDEAGTVAAVATGATVGSAASAALASGVASGPAAPVPLSASDPEREEPDDPALPDEPAPPTPPDDAPAVEGNAGAVGASSTTKAKPMPFFAGPSKATWKLSGPSVPSTSATEVEPR